MSNFAEISDVESFLQITISGDADQEAAANQALEFASAAIREYCRQTIDIVYDDVITLDIFEPNSTRVFLPELPVVSVDLVVENSETLTESDDYKLGQYGILHRIDDSWYEGIQTVTITYTHGYDYGQIPDAIIAVCTAAAARKYQAGLGSAAAGGIPGVASKSLGDFSVSYQSTAGGGTGEGLMGASAARFLLLSEKDMLNRFRLRGL